LPNNYSVKGQVKCDIWNRITLCRKGAYLRYADSGKPKKERKGLMTPEYFSGVAVHPGLDALNLVGGDVRNCAEIT
jgi:hypothetical protein